MKYFLFFIVTMLFLACSRKNVHFSSPDGENNISIFTKGETRYIIDGIHSKIPDTGYIKIDISKVDREVGDQVVGCWNKNGFEWIVLMDNVKIIENRLDQSKHRFLSNFPKDTIFKVPTLKGYREENCFSISFSYRSIERIEGAVVGK